MRNLIIIVTTLIICIYLIFFDPFKKYLGIYKNKMFIEHAIVEDGYHWECFSDGILDLEKISENKWSFNADKNGYDNIMFNFVNNETGDIKYNINYKFKIRFNNIFWTAGEATGLLDFSNPY